MCTCWNNAVKQTTPKSQCSWQQTFFFFFFLSVGWIPQGLTGLGGSQGLIQLAGWSQQCSPCLLVLGPAAASLRFPPTMVADVRDGAGAWQEETFKASAGLRLAHCHFCPYWTSQGESVTHSDSNGVEGCPAPTVSMVRAGKEKG